MVGIKSTYWKWCKTCREYYKSRVCPHTAKKERQQVIEEVKENLERTKLIE